MQTCWVDHTLVRNLIFGNPESSYHFTCWVSFMKKNLRSLVAR